MSIRGSAGTYCRGESGDNHPPDLHPLQQEDAPSSWEARPSDPKPSDHESLARRHLGESFRRGHGQGGRSNAEPSPASWQHPTSRPPPSQSLRSPWSGRSCLERSKREASGRHHLSDGHRRGHGYQPPTLLVPASWQDPPSMPPPSQLPPPRACPSRSDSTYPSLVPVRGQGDAPYSSGAPADDVALPEGPRYSHQHHHHPPSSQRALPPTPPARQGRSPPARQSSGGSSLPPLGRPKLVVLGGEVALTLDARSDLVTRAPYLAWTPLQGGFSEEEPRVGIPLRSISDFLQAADGQYGGPWRAIRDGLLAEWLLLPAEAHLREGMPPGVRRNSWRWIDDGHHKLHVTRRVWDVAAVAHHLGVPSNGPGAPCWPTALAASLEKNRASLCGCWGADGHRSTSDTAHQLAFSLDATTRAELETKFSRAATESENAAIKHSTGTKRKHADSAGTDASGPNRPRLGRHSQLSLGPVSEGRSDNSAPWDRSSAI